MTATDYNGSPIKIGDRVKVRVGGYNTINQGDVFEIVAIGEFSGKAIAGLYCDTYVEKEWLNKFFGDKAAPYSTNYLELVEPAFTPNPDRPDLDEML